MKNHNLSLCSSKWEEHRFDRCEIAGPADEIIDLRSGQEGEHQLKSFLSLLEFSKNTSPHSREIAFPDFDLVSTAMFLL